MNTITYPTDPVPTPGPAGPEKITLRICDSEQTGAITDFAALHGVARTSAASAFVVLGVQTWRARAVSAACQRVAGIRAQDVTPSASHALAGGWRSATESPGQRPPRVITKLPLEKITMTVRDPGLLASLDAYAEAHGFRARTTAAAALFALGVETWRGSINNPVGPVATEVVSHGASSAVAAPRLPAANNFAATEPDRAARDLQLLLEHCRSPQVLADVLRHAHFYNGAASDADTPYDAQEAADFIVSSDDEQSLAFRRCLQVIKEAVGLPHDEANFGLLRRVFLQKKRALREACKSNARAIARQVAHRLVTRDAIRNAFFSAPVALHGADLSADFDSGIEAMAEGEISWDALAVAVRECLREGTS